MTSIPSEEIIWLYIQLFSEEGEIRMDDTERKITKIAREAERLVVKTMRSEGIGTAEFDFVHFVRHHPGVTQSEVCESLNIDKAAAARRAANLELKGYIKREENPCDKRSRLLYATEKAETLKKSKSYIESVFYDWHTEDLCELERDAFCMTLNKLYIKSKKQRQSEFCDVWARISNNEES